MYNRKMKFYQRELAFPEKKMKLENKEAKKLALKLARHFKINLAEIKFRKGIWSLCMLDYRAIHFCNNPSIENICHELGHLYVFEHYPYSGKFHTKKLWKTIEKFLRYCRKKNYWLSQDNPKYLPASQKNLSPSSDFQKEKESLNS